MYITEKKNIAKPVVFFPNIVQLKYLQGHVTKWKLHHCINKMLLLHKSRSKVQDSHFSPTVDEDKSG